MTDISANNKRIAKNTVLLYIRMLLSIVVSLYTSRVVLQTLGVDDYGIYGVVGGVVVMFSFLNASMSGATSRFITFALGKESKEEVNKTFSTALIIHIGIALAVIILSETIGFWFLEKKLVIPEDRMNAARIVYQFSVLAMAVQVTQVPYNASIISYEKMDVYAYVELLNVFLKLGIVYLLMVCNFDKLMLYAALVLAVNVIIAFSYRIYCVKKFDTCKFHWVIDKKLLIPMLSFSGWDLYGNMCYSVRQQGVNMLINMFFGVALNAANSVATTVQGTLFSLSANVIQAFRPQIIKQYAQAKYKEMESLMCNSVRYSILLFAMVGVPLAYKMYPIMELWLGTVPENAPEFCVVLLAISLFNLINSVLCTAIHATGKIKLLSMVSGTVYLMTIPVIFLLFKYLTDNSIYAYITSFATMVLVVVSNMIIVHRQIPQVHMRKHISSIILAIVISAIASPALLVSKYMVGNVLQICVAFVCYIFLLCVLTYFLGIDKSTRSKVNAIIAKKISKR